MTKDDTKKPGLAQILEEAKKIAESASESAVEIGKSVAENVKQLKEAAEGSEAWASAKAAAENATKELKESDAWAAAKATAEEARERISDAAGDASAKVREVRDTAKKVIDTLQSAPEDIKDRECVVTRFVELIPIVRKQFDKEANAFAIGYLGEAGIGVAGLTGVEILYVRKDDKTAGQLRVSQLDGKVARLAVGASTSAYVGCLYGEPEALAFATNRRGADVDVFVASIAFFRAANTVSESKATGWLVGLSAGLDLGVPILSNFSGFDFEEQLLGRVTLDDAETKRIEDALGDLTDRPLRRKVAKSL